MKAFLSFFAIVLAGFQANAQTAHRDNRVSESITFSAKPAGPGVYGIFEGRTPCQTINRQLQGGLPSGLDHLKWQLILFRDSLTRQPSTYSLKTEMFGNQPITGRWRISRGKKTIYILQPDRPGRPLYLLKGDKNVLFILDEKREPLTGDKDFSYTLNRVHKVLRPAPH